MRAPTQHIGMVGGLGPAATVLYYQLLLAGMKRLNATLRLTISHADVEQVFSFATTGSDAEMALYIDGFLDELIEAGARVLAIAAVTPHLCTKLLPEKRCAPFVDLVQATVNRLKGMDVGRVVLLGTRSVTSTAFFGRLPQATASRPETCNEVHDLYVSIVREVAAAQNVASKLSAIARQLLLDQGADAVLLAGTELSLIPRKAWGDLPIIDCTEIHVQAILDAASGLPEPARN